jgi:uncharacterized membrane protein
MKTNKTAELVIALAVLAPLGVAAWMWNDLPPMMPTHWNMEGRPDDFMPKFPGAVLLPLINAVMSVVLKYIVRLDPKRENYAQFSRAYSAIRIALAVFFAVLSVYTLVLSTDTDMAMGPFVAVCMSLLFLVLGNYLRNIRHNYFVGVRTPWTLADEDVWRITHRFTSTLWIIGSLLMLAVILLVPAPTAMGVFIGFAVVLGIIPVMYSYIVFRRKRNSGAV